VIQHPATKRYMEENFEDDRRFMIGLMGKGNGIERVQARTADVTVPDMLSVDLGGRMVEVRHFCGCSLFAWAHKTVNVPAAYREAYRELRD
jgi:hypothetical protein